MRALNSCLRIVLLAIVSILFPLLLMAATLDQAQIEENKKLAEAAGNTAAATTYSKAAAQLKLAELARDDTQRYAASIDRFIDQLAELEKNYAGEFKPVVTRPESMSQFDLLFGQLDAEALRLQKRQGELNQILLAIGDRALQIPPEIQKLNQEEAALPVIGSTGNISQDDAASQWRQASLTRIAAQREALEMERLSSKNRTELARSELRLVEADLDKLQLLRESFQQQRETFSQNQFEQLRRAVINLRERADGDADLLAYVGQTLQLIERLRAVELQWQKASAQREAFEKNLTELAAARKTFEEELAVSTASMVLGVPLLERYDNLLRTVHIDKDRLKDVHISRLAFAQLAPAADFFVADASLPPTRQAQYQQLRDYYRQIFDSASQYYENLIIELIRFNGLYSDMAQKTEELRRLITKNSLWVANVSAIDVPWLRQVVTSSFKFVDDFQTQIIGNLLTSLTTLAPSQLYLLLALVLLVIRQQLRRRLAVQLPVWAADIGQIRADHISATLYALFATLAVAMIWVLPFLLLGQYLQSIEPGTGHMQALANMLFVVARFLLVVRFLMFASLADGLFAAHLRLPETLIRSLWKPLRWAEWVGGLLVATCVLMYQWPEPAVLSGIGRLLFLLLSLFVSLWIWFLVGEIQMVAVYMNMRPLWLTAARMVLTALPVIAALAIALGYFSLAQLLLDNAHETLLALLIVLLAFMVIRRMFAIQERRLAYERALERRNEERQRRKKAGDEANSESPIEIAEFEIDTAVLRSRSMSLLQLAAFAIFLGIVAQIWSDFLLAFDWLNTISLWETVRTVGASQSVQIVTLADLLVMLVIFAVTAILAINLPSLIDLLLLQNMKLQPGVGFAVMTVTSYIVVLVGVFAGFSTIGIDWSKMQWLVAAIGLGVGFGLQEVVANLVSGLIILFERPIRLGDLITVQGESGTVSRIRMRATTIVDFDRREIVVPNKILLSEKITNWSLTDGITRVVVNVGVAYGSDVDLVERLLLQAARESAIVLAEPQPEVFFTAFGNSTLDFELRVFAEEIGRRMPARDDLHFRILELFKQHGISIAYPQMDVHIVSDARRPPAADSA